MTLALTGAGPTSGAAPYIPDATILALGPAAWYAADAVPGSDGATVASWDDLSGNARTMGPKTSGTSPTLKTNIQNGLPVVRFNGVSNTLKAAFTLNKPTTVYWVGKQYAWAGKYLIDGINVNTLIFQQNGVANQIRMYADPGGGFGFIDPGITAFHLLEAVYNGASSKLALDGGTDVTGTVGTGAAGGLTLASAGSSNSNYAQVDICEVIVFASALSTDRATVRSYLRTKWGTP